MQNAPTIKITIPDTLVTDITAHKNNRTVTCFLKSQDGTTSVMVQLSAFDVHTLDNAVRRMEQSL